MASRDSEANVAPLFTHGTAATARAEPDSRLKPVRLETIRLWRPKYRQGLHAIVRGIISDYGLRAPWRSLVPSGAVHIMFANPAGSCFGTWLQLGNWRW